MVPNFGPSILPQTFLFYELSQMLCISNDQRGLQQTRDEARI